MKKAARILVILLLASMAIALPAAAQQGVVAKTNLKVGDKAPDFTLLDQNGNPVTLSSFQGKKTVILAFYVLAFTGG